MRRFLSRVVSSLLLLTTGLATIGVVSSAASSAQAVARCRYGQLEVTDGWGPGAAAGHVVVPFVIVNISHTTCSLIGYPRLRLITAQPNKHVTDVVQSNKNSFMFAPVKVRRIVLAPGRVASFGMSLVDALNQQFGNPPSCMVNYIDVGLPVTGVEQMYQTTEIFNVCFSGFAVEVTPLEAGPYPKLR